jgi:chemotaxis protein CheD
MLNKINAAGLKRSELEVKFFGGSEMISSQDRKSGWKTVGQENIMTAARIIQSEGLKLISYDVGGTAGRKIHFHTGTGEVFLKRLRKTRNGIYCDDEVKTCKRSLAQPDIMKIAL